MKLHWSPRSPFVRKVMIVLDETGLTGSVECIRSVVSLSTLPNLDVLKDNPLGKIPVLVTEQEGALFDSRVICEYLNQISGKNLFHENLPTKYQVLRLQALADGLTDILLLWRNEINHPIGSADGICNSYEEKVKAVMQHLENETNEITSMPFNIGHISLVCALGQLDFRWAGCEWQTAFPQLFELNQKLQQRPSVQANAIQDDGLAPVGKPHSLNFLKESS